MNSSAISFLHISIHLNWEAELDKMKKENNNKKEGK